MRSLYAQTQIWSLVSTALQLLEVGPPLPSFLKKSTDYSQDDQQTLQILQNAQYLQNRGYPPGPYLLKANEAIAKGASPQRLHTALAQSWQKNQQAGQLSQRALSRGWAPNDLQHRQYWTQNFYRALDQGIAPEEINWLIAQPHPQDPQRANLQLQRNLREWQTFPGGRRGTQQPHPVMPNFPSPRPDFQPEHPPFSSPPHWGMEKNPGRHGPPKWKKQHGPPGHTPRWNKQEGSVGNHPGRAKGKGK